MGNVPSTSSESITDDQLLKLLDGQATLTGPPLTSANNRFLRSLRCRRAGETDATVAKVFFVKNLDLSPFVERLKIQKLLVTSEAAPNVLAYQRFREGGGPTPAFVSRQFVFANLKDRLSTRPFLSDAEKLWIAYGLISAGAQLHSVGLGHGDIKSENVMLTSWGWPILTDLAPFKPTFMQADQSAAPFNFFFSTGKKRCYLAPERFIVSSIGAPGSKSSSRDALKRRFGEVLGSKDADARKASEALADAAGVGRSSRDAKDAQMAQTALKVSGPKGGVPADMDMSNWRRDVNDDLLPSMDVFSIGCVLAELFNADAEATFELSDILHYASRGESPRLTSLLGKIVDPGMRALVESMTQSDPAKRLRLEDYLQEFSPKVFPVSFRETLYPFMKTFLAERNVEDALVWRTCERYGELVESLMGVRDEVGTNLFQGFFKAKSDRETFVLRKSRTASAHVASAVSLSAPSPGSVSSGATPSPFVAQQYDPDDTHFRAVEDLIRDLEQKLNAVVKPHASSLGQGSLRKGSLSTTEEEQTGVFSTQQRTLPSGIVIIISYLCNSAQYASKAGTRVVALLITKRLCLLEADSELILSRVLPFFVDRLRDQSAWVRCTALQALAELLESVSALPPSECKIFPDFLLPALSDCARDSSEAVRVTFASLLPSIASSAKRFLELARQHQQLAISAAQTASATLATGSTSVVSLPSYDAELGMLHDSMQKMIDRTISTEHTPGGGADIAVKAALVTRVMQLCQFFGRDRIDRWLLPWLLSVVNTRGPGNWRLQVAVLNSLASIGAFVGSEAFDQYLYPLIDDMLTNGQELVVEAAAHSLTSLVRLGLLKPMEMFKLVKKVAPMCRHPSVRLQKAAILLLAAISSQNRLLPHVDVQLNVAEKLKSYISPKNNNEGEKFIVLLGRAGQGIEVNAALLEQCLNLEPYTSHQEWLQEFAAVGVSGNGKKQSSSANILAAGKGSTGSILMASSAHNSKFFNALEKDFKGVVRIHFLKTNEGLGGGSGAMDGMFNLKAVKTRYGIVVEEQTTARALLRRALALGLPEVRLNLGRLKLMENYYSAPNRSPLHPQQNLSEHHTPAQSPTASGAAGNYGGGGAHGPSPSTSSALLYSTSTPLVDWKPRGLLVSSLHEHSGPVNRIAVSDDFSFFTTGSDDGTARVWRTDKLDRNPCPRSRVTFDAQGRVIDVVSVRNSSSIVVAAESGRVSIVRLDAATAQMESHRSLRASSTDSARLVSIACNSASELFACTERGSVLQWDLRSAHRSRGNEMSLVPGLGSVSCMAMSPDKSWLALGTHRGVIAVFDLRFNLLIAAWRHPCSCAIHRLYCPAVTEGLLPLLFVAAGPNQAVLLNLETGETRVALACAQPEFGQDKNKLGEWRQSQEALFSRPYDRIDLGGRQIDRYVQEAKFASSNSGLHPNQAQFAAAPQHSIRAMLCPSDVYCGTTSSSGWASTSLSGSATTGFEPPSLLTAGTDMVVRFWDLHHVSNSSVVSAPQDEPKIKWESRELPGGKNQQLLVSLSGPRAVASTGASGVGAAASASASSAKNKTKFIVRPAHSDAILDMNALRMSSDSSAHIITAGRDSVVRVWK